MSAITGVISLSQVALNPIATASLLWVLTKSPPQIRGRLLDRFAALRDPRRLARTLTALKALLAFGLLGAVNRQLNSIALNAWRLRSEKKRWQFNQEIAVITGGCSGIGEMIVKGLVKKGVTVVILDIQQLPASLQGCTL
jgi:all-trans-retinol dehydrogenase (NAD+)